MAPLIFLFYALGHLALFVWSLALFLRHRNPGTVPLLIVTFGLIYDNAMLAVGGFIGHGELLEQLSVPRFFMHAFGTPLLMLSALGLARRSGARWAHSRATAVLVVGPTLAMIAVGVQADLVGLELRAMEVAEVVSYGNAATSGPPVAPIVTIFVLIASAAVVWWHTREPWLLAGALAQFAAAAVGDAIVIAGNLGELALLAGLVKTDYRLSSVRSPAAVHGS